MNLKEKLLKEYDDIVLAMNDVPPGDEEYVALDKRSQKILDEIVRLEEMNSKVEIENAKISSSEKELEKKMEHESKLERLRIIYEKEAAEEKELHDHNMAKCRHDDEMEVEKLKKKESFSRMMIESAKIIVPTLVPIIAYNIFQKRVMKYEETGRIVSTAGRELHLPKFMK